MAPIGPAEDGVHRLDGSRALVALTGTEHGLRELDAPDIFTWALEWLDAFVADDRAARARVGRMLRVTGGGDDVLRIDYVAPRNIDAVVREEFQKMLDAKGATRTTVDVRHVPAIENDPKTGKLRLVKFEARQAKRTHRIVDREVAEIAPRWVHVKPGPSFVPFARVDIEQSIPARFGATSRKIWRSIGAEERRSFVKL